jgi:hypothetical protein
VPLVFVGHIIQIFRSGGWDRLQPKIIQDQQTRSQVGGQAPVQSAVRSSAVQMLEGFLDAGKEHVESLAGRFLPKRLREVGSPDPGWAADQQIAFLTHIFAGGQVEDLLAVEVGIEVEIEAFQGLGAVEDSPAQAQLELLLGTALDFTFQGAGEELQVTPLVVDRLTIARFQGFQNSGKAQMAELFGLLMFQFHGCTSARGATGSSALRTKVMAGGSTTGPMGLSASKP